MLVLNDKEMKIRGSVDWLHWLDMGDEEERHMSRNFFCFTHVGKLNGETDVYRIHSTDGRYLTFVLNDEGNPEVII